MILRLRLAALAAILALLLSAAVVPFVSEWHHWSRTVWIDDPEHIGRVKLISIFFPIYWFHVAAGLGTFLASLIALKSGEGLHTRSVVFFLLLSDFFYTWVGASGYDISQAVLLPDFWTHKLLPPSTLDRIERWAEVPLMGLLSGPIFGNFATYGFGFLIGLPTVLWLAVRRISTNNPRLRGAEVSD